MSNVTIINQTEAKDIQNEIIQDRIANITSLSRRFQGMRSRGKRKSLKQVKKHYSMNILFHKNNQIFWFIVIIAGALFPFLW